MKKIALISVYDKKNIEKFASDLIELGFSIISTGGTYKLLKDKNLPVKKVEDITNFKEILSGRVKTLHPIIHAGILANRDDENHNKEMEELGISHIDLVAVNLYPFSKVIENKDSSYEEAIENIDIGGPTMLRAAAKNHKDIITVSSPCDYDEVIAKLKDSSLCFKTRQKLALKTFEHVSYYDSIISEFLRKECCKDISESQEITIPMRKLSKLRYGENPSQRASIWSLYSKEHSIANSKILMGKEMSFNNYSDLDAAIWQLKEFKNPACVCLKHACPCAVSELKGEQDIINAYKNAHRADPVSVFGGIVAFNREVDSNLAKELSKTFLEIVIAPSFSKEALEIFKEKKNLRLVELDCSKLEYGNEIKSISGAFLIQNKDDFLFESLEFKTFIKPSEKELEDLIFAYKVVKHAKSNAIVTAKNLSTVGIGTGQVSRVWAAKNACENTYTEIAGSVMASDAFIPFPDTIEIAHKNGIKSIIQPGGSKNDKEVIEKADELGISMVFTKSRHFRH